jgi:hypothetical protein
MKILLGDFNVKAGGEDIFKPTIGNEGLHKTRDDNGVRVVNFAISKNLTVKSTLFTHRNIHKSTWISPEAFKCGYVQSFRGAGCDTDHYLVMEKVRGSTLKVITRI